MIVPAQNMGLMLSAFRAGIDDVFYADIEPREAVARIQAVGRRYAGKANPILQIGDLTIDTALRTVHCESAHLPLTRIEYELVEFLALNEERVLSKHEIMDKLYAQGDAPDASIVAVYVCTIRNKLAAAGGNPNVFETIWGRGYSLKAPVDVSQVA